MAKRADKLKYGHLSSIYLHIICLPGEWIYDKVGSLIPSDKEEGFGRDRLETALELVNFAFLHDFMELGDLTAKVCGNTHLFLDHVCKVVRFFYVRVAICGRISG